MERFARTIIGYHGCEKHFAQGMLLGRMKIEQWQPSQNMWDWLGDGIYFWEHSPSRALRWAVENCNRPAVVGVIIQLGACFDLMDESITAILADSYAELVAGYVDRRKKLPNNTGAGGKLRRLDRLVINDCLYRLGHQGIHYDTVRAAFLEGDPAYPDAGFCRETHIQVAVRNSACILGVFRPNL